MSVHIGRFFKVLFVNFLTEVADNLVAVLKNITLSVKTTATNFWAIFGKFGLLFILTSGHTESTMPFGSNFAPVFTTDSTK